MHKIHVEVIPHEAHRYETVGDWYRGAKPGQWQIRVSHFKDWRHAFLVAIHEQVEMALCEQRGIAEDTVTQFDLDFEAARQEGDYGEPGDAPTCPYRLEHRTAENIERLLAIELGVDWAEYERAIEEDL